MTGKRLRSQGKKLLIHELCIFLVVFIYYSNNSSDLPGVFPYSIPSPLLKFMHFFYFFPSSAYFRFSSFVLHLISVVASSSALPGQPHLTLHTRGSSTVKGGTDLPFLLSHIFPLPHIFLNSSAPPQAAIKQFNSDGTNSCTWLNWLGWVYVSSLAKSHPSKSAK